MTTPSREKYNNFFEQNGFKLESNDPELKLVLLGTKIYLFDTELKCYVINDSASLFVKHFTEDYDEFQIMPYSGRLIEMMWDNFNESTKLDELADKYDLTDDAKELLETSLRVDIYRDTTRDYVLNSKVKPIYLSPAFNEDMGFDINPRLGFWNGQIWSVTDDSARLELNDIDDIVKDNWKQGRSYIAMLGQPYNQVNPLEQKLKEQDHIVFVKDDLGRQGFLSMENLEKLKSIYASTRVKSYTDLK